MRTSSVQQINGLESHIQAKIHESPREPSSASGAQRSWGVAVYGSRRLGNGTALWNCNRLYVSNLPNCGKSARLVAKRLCMCWVHFMALSNHAKHIPLTFVAWLGGKNCAHGWALHERARQRYWLRFYWSWSQRQLFSGFVIQFFLLPQLPFMQHAATQHWHLGIKCWQRLYQIHVVQHVACIHKPWFSYFREGAIVHQPFTIISRFYCFGFECGGQLDVPNFLIGIVKVAD